MAITSELKLDFDVEHNIKNKEIIVSRINKVLSMCGLEGGGVLKRTTNGYHATVVIYDVSLGQMDILMLQALCGSDWKRETFNFIRFKQTGNAGNILFNKKYRKGKLVSYEGEISTQL